MSELLSYLDPRQKRLAVGAITVAIDASYQGDTFKPTTAETRRRFDICLKLIGIMRNDLGWSWPRIQDTLTSALRMKLDTGDWSPPPARNAWITSPASGLILPPGLK